MVLIDPASLSLLLALASSALAGGISSQNWEAPASLIAIASAAEKAECSQAGSFFIQYENRAVCSSDSTRVNASGVHTMLMVRYVDIMNLIPYEISGGGVGHGGGGVGGHGGAGCGKREVNDAEIDNSTSTSVKRDFLGRQQILAENDNSQSELDKIYCPDGLHACSVNNPGGGHWAYECLDFLTELNQCGGCLSTGKGRDCSAIPNAASVGCESGVCMIYSCKTGFSVDGTECVQA